MLLSALLTALGFGSCSDNEEPVEYGTPNVNFTVKGTVTSTDGKPLAGIKVQSQRQYLDNVVEEAADTTDANGNYELPRQNTIDIDYGRVLVATDIDGDANGGDHETATAQFGSLPRTQVAKGSGNWNLGDYEVTGNLKMNKK